MRVDAGASTPMRRGAAPSIAIASALFAAALVVAGCKTVSDPIAKAPPMTTPAPLQKALTSVEATEIAALPDGPAKVLVTERCLLCHGSGLITAQHKDAAAWDRTVTQMRTWGTPIQDDDQKALVAYLAQHFGPKAPSGQ